MAKLSKILAASFGGGILLGAGIRLGENIAAKKVLPPAPDTRDDARIDAIEKRLERNETRLDVHEAQLSELRDCALRNEHTLHALLSRLDQLIPARQTRENVEPEPGSREVFTRR